MIETVVNYFSQVPLAGLMLVVTLGYLLGRVEWRGLGLGPGGGTLFVALGAGWLGLSLETLYGGVRPTLTVGQLGFALFIYSVGFEAGPQFVSGLRSGRGLRYVAVGAAVVAAATACMVLIALITGADGSVAAGTLAGALSSAAAYAAASGEATDAARLSIAFALTYPLGLVVAVLSVQLLPRVTGTDLARETVELPGGNTVVRVRTPELTRAFEVTQPDVCGKSLRELNLTRRSGCMISRIHRKGEVLIVGADSTLELGDHVLVLGRLDELQVFEGLVGPEVYDSDLRERLPEPRRVHVTSSAVAGKSLKELNLIGRHRCMIARVERGHEVLEPSADLVLMRHDIVDLIGQRAAVKAASAELGRFEPSTQATDIAIYAGGILIGLLIGSVHFRPFGLDLSFGPAGGLLIAGITLACVRKVGPFSANVPKSARQLVRDLGILLFVGETGVLAGSALTQGLNLDPWPVLGSALVVAFVPLLVALGLGRLLKLRPVELWGSICGGLTSSAALAAVKRSADSDEPAHSYATAFAVSIVLVTIAGQVVGRVL